MLMTILGVVFALLVLGVAYKLLKKIAKFMFYAFVLIAAVGAGAYFFFTGDGSVSEQILPEQAHQQLQDSKNSVKQSAKSKVEQKAQEIEQKISNKVDEGVDQLKQEAQQKVDKELQEIKEKKDERLNKLKDTINSKEQQD